ncbi:hypothetical protein CS022_13595 [Veronia nyctiphanis]|uniref:Uncharacterized protein n=1 Tax=Veronia nyctiphanis TaxID=1278244 RepID=A0A4Q0YPJ3_9GAMM|nr:hypothetical protein [Veronia nyctiphanis]RXJ72876.1 hypothetical protein CS022_13595 [Veronia nyctiphanis]
MTSEVVYRCKNKGGPDGDCEHASSDDNILSSLITISETGEAICPGETVFGEPCGSVLEKVIPPKKIPWALITSLLSGIAIIAGFVWFILLRGDAVIRIEDNLLTLSPGQTVKVEVFNDGEVTLKLNDVIFSQEYFSAELPEGGLEIEPGTKENFRVKFAKSAQDSVNGIMTIDSNSAGEPITIKVVGNANPWGVVEKINKKSTILDKE